MEFKKLLSNRMLILFLFVFFVIVGILWRFIPKAEPLTTDEALPSSENLPAQVVLPRESELDTSKEDAVIEQQLNRDRQEQKQTKYLKNKLEQTNLELEQERALAEINKLKMENIGTFKDTSSEGQNSLPEIKVEYIGGDTVKKEAILSIAGTSFRVKEKSSPTDNIQVMAISNSSVTLHFSAPQELTKTIEYKPE